MHSASALDNPIFRFGKNFQPIRLTIELAPDVEQRLNCEAQRQGVKPADFVQGLVERELPPAPKEFDLNAYFALPREEQDRILEEAAKKATPQYAADLAFPVEERELTAFTVLDGEPYLEY